SVNVALLSLAKEVESKEKTVGTSSPAPGESEMAVKPKTPAQNPPGSNSAKPVANNPPSASAKANTDTASASKVETGTESSNSFLKAQDSAIIETNDASTKRDSTTASQPNQTAVAQEAASQEPQKQQSTPEWHYGGFVDVGYLLDFNHPANKIFRSRGT